MSTQGQRLDLQPNTKIQYSNIDPKTGLTLDGSYRVYNTDGSPVRVDGNGYAIFDAISYNDPAWQGKNLVKFDPRKSTVNVDSVKQILNTQITELGTRKETIVTDGPFGDLCNILRDILDGGDTNGGGGGGININGTDIGDGGGGIGGPGDGTYQDLLELISRAEDEIANCAGYEILIGELQVQIGAVEQELQETADQLEDLLDLVEALQACKERLERAVDKKDAIIGSLTENLRNSENVNEALVQKVKEQEQKIQKLIDELTARSEENDKELADSLADTANTNEETSKTNQAVVDTLNNLDLGVNVTVNVENLGPDGTNEGGRVQGGSGQTGGSTVTVSQIRSDALYVIQYLPQNVVSSLSSRIDVVGNTKNAASFTSAWGPISTAASNVFSRRNEPIYESVVDSLREVDGVIASGRLING